MLEEERKKYLTIANNLYEIVEGFNHHIYDKNLHFDIVGDGLESFNNYGSTVNYLYENNLTILKADLVMWFRKIDGELMPTVTLTCALDLDNEIRKSVYELLKEHPTIENIDYALTNGHITFKEYNELYKQIKVNGGKTL